MLLQTEEAVGNGKEKEEEKLGGVRRKDTGMALQFLIQFLSGRDGFFTLGFFCFFFLIRPYPSHGHHFPRSKQ